MATTSDESIRLVAPIAFGVENGFRQYDDWRLVRPLMNQDRRAAENLAVRGIPTFCAMAEYTSRNGRGHLTRKVRPLFPTYVFAAAPVGDHYGPLGIASVEPIANQWQLCLDLHRLEAMRKADRPVLCPRTLVVGEQVRITAGPYVGIVGPVVSIRGRRMVAVAIDYMGRSIPVDLEAWTVEPLPHCSPAPAATVRAG